MFCVCWDAVAYSTHSVGYLSVTETPHETKWLRVCGLKKWFPWNLNTRPREELRHDRQAALYPGYTKPSSSPMTLRRRAHCENDSHTEPIIIHDGVFHVKVHYDHSDHYPPPSHRHCLAWSLISGCPSIQPNTPNTGNNVYNSVFYPFSVKYLHFYKCTPSQQKRDIHHMKCQIGIFLLSHKLNSMMMQVYHYFDIVSLGKVLHPKMFYLPRVRMSGPTW